MLKITEETQPSQEPEGQPALDFGLVCAHLANERTFLAWACTSILIMGFGIAVAKMRIALTDFSQSAGALPQSTGTNEISPITMGMLFLAVGMLTLLMAAYRYLTVQTRLKENLYNVANLHVLVFFSALLFMGGTLMLHVIQLRQIM